MRTRGAALLVVATLACGGGSTGPSGPRIRGTFALDSANHAALPYCTYTDGTHCEWLTAGALTFTGDGSVTIAGTYTTPDGSGREESIRRPVKGTKESFNVDFTQVSGDVAVGYYAPGAIVGDSVALLSRSFVNRTSHTQGTLVALHFRRTP